MRVRVCLVIIPSLTRCLSFIITFFIVLVSVLIFWWRSHNCVGWPITRFSELSLLSSCFSLSFFNLLSLLCWLLFDHGLIILLCLYGSKKVTARDDMLLIFSFFFDLMRQRSQWFLIVVLVVIILFFLVFLVVARQDFILTFLVRSAWKYSRRLHSVTFFWTVHAYVWVLTILILRTNCIFHWRPSGEIFKLVFVVFIIIGLLAGRSSRLWLIHVLILSLTLNLMILLFTRHYFFCRALVSFLDRSGTFRDSTAVILLWYSHVFMFLFLRRDF